MMMALGRHAGPIGLDIGSRTVKAAQLEWRGGQARLRRAALFPRRTPDAPLEEAEAARIAAVMLRRGFVGREVVLAIPRQRLLSNLLELPARSSGAPLDQIARNELARAHQLEPEQIEMGWWELPAQHRANEPTHAMAVGCPCEAADHLLDLFAASGLEVVGLDAEPLACSRALAPLLNDAPELVVILDLGWSATRIMLWRQGAIVYERTVTDVGWRQLVARLRQREGLSGEVAELVLEQVDLRPRQARQNTADPDAPQTASTQTQPLAVRTSIRATIAAHLDDLVREVQAALTYATQRQAHLRQQAQLLLVGGGAQLDGLDQNLAQALRCDVQVVRAMPIACAGLSADLHSAPLITAIGLARYDVTCPC